MSGGLTILLIPQVEFQKLESFNQDRFYV